MSLNNNNSSQKRKACHLDSNLSSQVKVKKIKVQHLQCTSLEELNDFLTCRVIELKGVRISLTKDKNDDWERRLFYWTCNKCNGKGCEHNDNHQAYHLRVCIRDALQTNFTLECTLFGEMAVTFAGFSAKELSEMGEDAAMAILAEKSRFLYDILLKEKRNEPGSIYVAEISVRVPNDANQHENAN